MRFAKRSMFFCLCCLLLGLVGCVTTPLPTKGEKTAPVASQQSSPEPAIDPAVRRNFERALSAIKGKRYKFAEKVLLTLTRDHPELSGPYANLGIVYFHQEKMPEAEEYLNKAIGINPDRAEYHNQLGIVYRRNGQFEKALDAYQRALQIDPNYPTAHRNIGILYDLYFQNTSKALEHYEQYQRLLPDADAEVSKWIADLKRRNRTAVKNNRRENG